MPEDEFASETATEPESELLGQSLITENGEVDIKLMRTEFITCSRVVHTLRQEMQQLRNQVQRTLTQVKQLEARIGRR